MGIDITGKTVYLSGPMTGIEVCKHDEVDGLKSDNADLQARLDASIPLPVHADGSVSDVEACKVTLTNDDEAGEQS